MIIVIIIMYKISDKVSHSINIICFYTIIWFLPSSGRIDTAIWMHYLDANKTAEEKARRQLHKNAASNIEQILEATQSTNYTATSLP